MLKICSIVLLFGWKPACSSDSSSSALPLSRLSIIRRMADQTYSSYCSISSLWYHYYERFCPFSWPSLCFPNLLAYDHMIMTASIIDKFSWYVVYAGEFLCLQHSDCFFYFCSENGRISIFILRLCSEDVVICVQFIVA